jgi:hypothetical protein
MLWYKAWRESVVRFVVGVIALASLCLIVVLFGGRVESVALPPAMHSQAYSQHIYNLVYSGTAKPCSPSWCCSSAWEGYSGSGLTAPRCRLWFFPLAE